MSKQPLIANRFELGELIRQGGMGTVYRGKDTRNGQPVAIKLFKPEVLTASSDALERFRREVEALHRLDHPDIVRQVEAQLEAILYPIQLPTVSQPLVAVDTDLTDALHDLIAKWEARAHDANTKRAGLCGDEVHTGYYYRAVAETYKAVVQDVRELLQHGADLDAASDEPIPFVEVSRFEVERLLERTGMRAGNLYEDKGHVFTVVFPNMPPIPMEDRVARLRRVARSLVLLEHGKLSDTQQPYIDFAFSEPPQI